MKHIVILMITSGILVPFLTVIYLCVCIYVTTTLNMNNTSQPLAHHATLKRLVVWAISFKCCQGDKPFVSSPIISSLTNNVRFLWQESSHSVKYDTLDCNKWHDVYVTKNCVISTLVANNSVYCLVAYIFV